MKVIVHINSIKTSKFDRLLFEYSFDEELTPAQKCKVDKAFRKKVSEMIYPSWFWQKKVDVCDLINIDIEVEIHEVEGGK